MTNFLSLSFLRLQAEALIILAYEGAGVKPIQTKGTLRVVFFEYSSTGFKSAFTTSRVRRLNRPEKLPLKIYTGSSGTFYSYWAVNVRRFAEIIGQVLVVKCQVRMFLILADFLIL
jgi:hypothetical protein